MLTHLPRIADAPVIPDSDRRGAIYGASDLSRTIGISLWCWQASWS
ncbi:hypothetical protein [Sphingomonas sp. PP-F2F-G114-C0414]|nr:hypothetical protein [Sphingomonas sp. PP-F2F-G114-C0414]